MILNPRLADRRWLEGDYLPSLIGRVLYVGVRSYNRGYQRLVKYPELFETVDVDPAQAIYGADIHHVCEAESLVDCGVYDHVALYGLFGMLDSYHRGEIAIVQFIRRMSAIVSRGGTMLVSSGTITLSRIAVHRILNLSLGLGSGFNDIIRFESIPTPEHKPVIIQWSKKE
jgi:hypothetical protein